ncbi:MAG: F0F1 ATP synthase subunit A [Planctomycetaceae bacterium]|nr:F0F1 ATP synthase subunit A [Planctomycetaceae bacterium]
MNMAEITEHIVHHVKDPKTIEYGFGEIVLPSFNTPFGTFQLTRYMLIEVLVAVILLVLFVPLARAVKNGKPPKGRIFNMLEAMLLYFRDEVVRPAIGDKKTADRFLPYIWTLFFFVLTCNLFGLVPFLGSPTGSLAITAVMACSTFIVVIGSGMRKFGVIGYWAGQVPHMDIPFGLGYILKPMIFVIEVFGLLVKHFVLAIRLLANMFAGHTVIAVFLSFVVMREVVVHTYLWVPVAGASIGMIIFMNMLELLVAFLQAYIISFLSALFIGMAVHQH